jgi:ribonuclease P protein component
MLPKKERLTTEMFDRFFSSSRRFHSNVLQIIYAPHNTFYGSVVVGKKVFPLAVKRNKLRRQIYNLLYRFKVERQLTGVFIILTKPQAKTIKFADLKEQLRDTLLQIEKSQTKG